MGDLIERAFNYIDSNVDKLVYEVVRFLRIPSVSATGEGIEETAEYLRDWISSRLGADVRLLRYGGYPIVYGRLDVGSDKTIILYNMYDVQPPEPLDKWVSPPFEAKIINGKIIARGAYNTKGALMSMLLGIEAYYRVGGEPPVNLVFVLEGEEEIGSLSLPKFVEDKGGELKGANMTYFAMPSEKVPGKPIVVLGNKGIVFVELRCKTSEYDVHSSLSRGLINPAAVLSKIISALIDPIKGPMIKWLDEKAQTPTDEDLRYINDIMEAYPLEKIIGDYGIRITRLRGRDWYIDVFFKPTVNVDGIRSGHVGPGTKTITPAEAVAYIDFRIVPGIEPEDVVNGLERLIDDLGLSGLVEIKIHDYYTWSKVSPSSPQAQASVRAYRRLNMKPYIIPMVPGSAPSHLFTRILGAPMISTGPGEGGRAHAPNEYITVDTIPKIAKYIVSLLEEVSKTPD